jgi:hypothetical protein
MNQTESQNCEHLKDGLFHSAGVIVQALFNAVLIPDDNSPGEKPRCDFLKALEFDALGVKLFEKDVSQHAASVR